LARLCVGEVFSVSRRLTSPDKIAALAWPNLAFPYTNCRPGSKVRLHSPLEQRLNKALDLLENAKFEI
jgi:hypothetical protein